MHCAAKLSAQCKNEVTSCLAVVACSTGPTAPKIGTAGSVALEEVRQRQNAHGPHAREHRRR